MQLSVSSCQIQAAAIAAPPKRDGHFGDALPVDALAADPGTGLRKRGGRGIGDESGLVGFARLDGFFGAGAGGDDERSCKGADLHSGGAQDGHLSQNALAAGCTDDAERGPDLAPSAI